MTKFGMPESKERAIQFSVQLAGTFFPLLIAFTFHWGGIWVYGGFFLLFLGPGFLDRLLSSQGISPNLLPDDEPRALFPPGFCLYTFAFLQLSCLAFLLLKIRELSYFEGVGLALSWGVMAGAIGGTAGHELVHRRNFFARALGNLLFLSISYPHFPLEHLLGHHPNLLNRNPKAASGGDWHSARYRESFYHFFLSGLYFGYRDGWRLETSRLRRELRPFWQNRILINSMVLTLLALALQRWGGDSLIFFFSASLGGLITFDLLNYVSHYGLHRGVGADGELEKLGSAHSWEWSTKTGNWLFFNGGKHSHHHACPHLPYEDLRLSADSAALPYSLLTTSLSALIPPLFFRLMEPHVQGRLLTQRKAQNPA